MHIDRPRKIFKVHRQEVPQALHQGADAKGTDEMVDTKRTQALGAYQELFGMFLKPLF